MDEEVRDEDELRKCNESCNFFAKGRYNEFGCIYKLMPASYNGVNLNVGQAVIEKDRFCEYGLKIKEYVDVPQ